MTVNYGKKILTSVKELYDVRLGNKNIRELNLHSSLGARDCE